MSYYYYCQYVENQDGVKGQNYSLSEPFYEVTTVFKFCLESAEDNIKLSCLTGSEKTQETVHVHCLLSGGWNTIDISLPPSNDDKRVRVCIEQGPSVLAEQEIEISKEVEPDYDKAQSGGRMKFVSNSMIQVLTDIVCGINEASKLGYKLGFSYSTVEKYLVRADSSARTVSRSGLREMIEDWRRRVRPSEQVEKLQFALEAARLRHEAEILFVKS
nr:uncharacterized protein LOC129263994 [Lytechinus pictus]